MYRVIFSFYIYEKSTQDWEARTKLSGGWAIASSLLPLILTTIGLIGVLKRKPNLVYWLGIGSGVYIGFWVGDIFGLAINSDNFTISPGLAWTLTITTKLLLYFPICAHSLYIKLCKEEKDEQVP